MRSIYFKAFLLSLGILIFSLAGYLVISRITTYRQFDPATPIGRNVRIQFTQATAAYETGGPKALDAYLKLQKKYYPRLNFYFTRNGHDLVTGVDHSQLLRRAGSRSSFLKVTTTIIIAASPTHNGDAFVVELPPQDDAMFYVDYYLLLLAAVMILCWGLAIQFASPLHQLAETVRRFGAGDLSARVRSNRRDAIGDVGRAFDHMGDRIEKLLLAERRLLQDISHELRSPLARLSFAAELARTATDRDGAAIRVHQEIDRLTNLVESLLQVSREDGDLSAHRLESTALDELMSELVRDCEIEAAARGSRLILKGATDVEFLADPVLLRRAFENILRNAIWHAPEGSAVEIALHTAEASTLVTVRDYGPGVPEEFLTQIFKPFFRVDSSRNADSGGVGLGLAITQRAIHAHDGRVWAENAWPGLRVSVELPVDHFSSKVQRGVRNSATVEERYPAGAYELEPGGAGD